LASEKSAGRAPSSSNRTRHPRAATTASTTFGRIDAAKQQWALEEKTKKVDAIPTVQDLLPYLKDGVSSRVPPRAGTYTINAVSDVPSCTVPGHVLQVTVWIQRFSGLGIRRFFLKLRDS